MTSAACKLSANSTAIAIATTGERECFLLSGADNLVCPVKFAGKIACVTVFTATRLLQALEQLEIAQAALHRSALCSDQAVRVRHWPAHSSLRSASTFRNWPRRKPCSRGSESNLRGADKHSVPAPSFGRQLAAIAQDDCS